MQTSRVSFFVSAFLVAAVTILLPLTVFAQAVSFSPAATFGAGTNPYGLAVGDFDSDDELDLAVSNYNGLDVSILLGDGAGSFGAAANFGIGANPFGLATGDFNEDGDLDLAVPQGQGTNVSIFLGNGAGSFGAATNFAVGDHAVHVAIEDLNGDDNLDLVVVNQVSGSVSVLLGDGAGSFGTATNFTVGTFPWSVAIQDLNNDGEFDLAVANQNSSNVSVLLGNGDGSFGTATDFAAGAGSLSVVIGDFNGDNNLDLATANFAGNSASVLLGDGIGSFSAATNFVVGATPFSVVVGDLNGDGELDLAVANHAGNSVSVLLGDGTGSFGAATDFGVNPGPTRMAIEDFNADGKLDLATANYSGNSVSILLNTTESTPLACGDTITADTTLDANMTCGGVSSHAINIGADNITLDCGGFTLTGDLSPDNIGVDNVGYDGVTVKNCNVTNFETGIHFGSGANNAIITDNTANANSTGFHIQNGSSYTVTGNTTNSSIVLPGNAGGYGMFITDLSDSNIADNIASSNTYDGIKLSSGLGNNTITGNTTNFDRFGIALDGISNNTLTNNTTDSNIYGIIISGGANNTLTGNIANSNRYGIQIGGSSSNTLTGNTTNSNSVGIVLGTASFNTLTGNTANSNVNNPTIDFSGYGIYIFSSSCSNILTNNTTDFNAKGGVFNDGSCPTPETGTLIVRKVIVDSASTADQFAFLVNGGPVTPFEADGENSLELAPGTYNIVERFQVGFLSEFSNCKGVVLDAGETETCTITNTSIHPPEMSGNLAGTVIVGSAEISLGQLTSNQDRAVWTIIGGNNINPSATFSYAIDNLKAIVNDSTLFDLPFNIAPPAGGPPSIAVFGTWSASGGEAFMDDIGAIQSMAVVPTPLGEAIIQETATILTNFNATLPGGFRSNNDFSIDGRFDLIIPTNSGSSYALVLIDGGSPNLSNQQVVMVVVRSAVDDIVRVRFVLENGNLRERITIDQVELTPASGDDQIEFHLNHIAGTHDITASFDLLDDGVVTDSRDMVGVAPIFDYIDIARVVLSGLTPGTLESQLAGTYGTLTIGEASGAWSYELGMTPAQQTAINGLAGNSSATDTFTVQLRRASSGPISTQTLVMTVEKPTAAQTIESLNTTIASMGLPAGVVSSLSATLGNINTNNVNSACGKVSAFVDKVNDKLLSGELTQAQANQLLQSANYIRTSLDC